MCLHLNTQLAVRTPCGVMHHLVCCSQAQVAFHCSPHIVCTTRVLMQADATHLAWAHPQQLLAVGTSTGQVQLLQSSTQSRQQGRQQTLGEAAPSGWRKVASLQCSQAAIRWAQGQVLGRAVSSYLLSPSNATAVRAGFCVQPTSGGQMGFSQPQRL